VAGDTATLATPSTLRSLTLDGFLDSRSAGFDLVRLVLAFLVLVSHTWTLGGFGNEPTSPFSPILTLGGFAVGGFFALSGLLVGRSALRRRPGSFARARFARVIPALWVAILFSAFVAAPIGWVHHHHHLSGFLTFRPDGPVAYVGRAVTLPVSFSHGIADVFATDTPYGIATHGGSWINGSLWTLPYEIRCYLVVGLVAVAARRFGSRRTVTIAWLISLALAVGYAKRVDLTSFVVGPYADRQLVAFLFVFLTGTLVAVWAHRISLFGWVPVAALALAIIAGHGSTFWSEHITEAAMALVLPPIAAIISPVARLLRGIDISYGLYLYSWPMQQLVALYHWGTRPATFIAVSTLLAGACAVASWFLIEHPSMTRLRRR
jgi:peptidoglycan/LPS O-acetylase OafA/YrhL